VVQTAGKTLPLFSLAEIFGQETTPSRRMTALVLHFQGRQAAFLVSRSLGVQELVVRGLGSQLKRVDFFSGATILGDGSPALILSVADLFSDGALGAGVRQKTPQNIEIKNQRQILVVDDSITTRTMERNILEAHGYHVTLAVSGPDALEKLGAATFDLIVSDVEMPGMTGFELTRQIRRNERTRMVPVIIVTSLSSDEDRRRGMEVGAQAYIVKGGFDQGVLLETVETLIG
jgi:two-component system chemotaxis sensor kinase CheA